MLRSFRNARRLFAIAIILGVSMMKPGLRRGQKFALALERLGPAFIKFGQALSTRSDLVGDEIAADLGGLRDKLPPFSSSKAIAIIEEEFGAPLYSIYKEFDITPVAAASIAQVHRATTLDGKKVAVKILRPKIAEAFARDVELFIWIAGYLEPLPSFRRLKPREVVNTFKESVFFELDLRFEAAAAYELAKNLTRYELGFRVPTIDWTLTSRRIMSMEWIDGIPLNDVAAIRAGGFNPDMILTKAARSLFSQVFEDGFFHADLHPGNLFVDKNGDIAAVDFGIMGRLDLNSRIYMAEILRGFIEEDYRYVAEMHFRAGYVPAHKSVEAFTQACMAVAKPITGRPLNEISVAKLLGQMLKIAAEFEMETQPQLLLLQKTMMVTEGVGRMLNPSLNMWELARPLMEQWAVRHFGPAGRIKDAARQGHELIQKLPSMLRSAEHALQSLGDPDGIRLHPLSIKEIHANRRDLQRGWLKLGWAALAVAFTFGVLMISK